MKLFLLKVSLFLIPLAIIFVPCYLYLSKYQEIDSYEEMARRNQAEETIIGLVFSDPGYKLKQNVIEIRKPRVITLGTSRVLQMREFFFRDPTSFYNCGRSVKKIKDYRAFLDSYPVDYPKCMIVGVDQDLFNGAFDDLADPARNYDDVRLGAIGRFMKTSKSLIKAFGKGKLDQSSMKSDSDIGVSAMLHGTGFRSDGSYCYGDQLLLDNYEFKTTLGRLTSNKKRFSTARKVNESALKEFEGFLAACREKDIEVVVFLPPYASIVYAKMAETPEKYPHVFELFEALKPICNRQNIGLYDYSDIKVVGSSDFETIDGFHGSEVCYLRLLMDLCRKDLTVASVADLEKCETLLERAYSSRQVIREIDEVSSKPVVGKCPLNR